MRLKIMVFHIFLITIFFDKITLVKDDIHYTHATEMS